MAAKPRTAGQLLDALDGAYSWRVQELSVIRSAIAKSSGISSSALVRAGIPILYAHWEGFVKQSTIHFADFITMQKFTYADLAVSFSGLRAHHYVTTMADVKKMIFTPSNLLHAIHAIEEDKVTLTLRPFLENVGNLSFDLFNEIISFLCLPVTNYLPFKPLIDESLLATRNRIAHGEYLALDHSGYEALQTETLLLIRMFKTDLENSAVSGGYLRA